MRETRGTALSGRGSNIARVVLGAIVAICAVLAIAFGNDTFFRVLSVLWLFFGCFHFWQGGYMLEWWGSDRARPPG